MCWAFDDLAASATHHLLTRSLPEVDERCLLGSGQLIADKVLINLNDVCKAGALDALQRIRAWLRGMADVVPRAAWFSGNVTGAGYLAPGD